VLGSDRESKSSHFLAGHVWSPPLLTCCVLHLAIPMNSSRTTENLWRVSTLNFSILNLQGLLHSILRFISLLKRIMIDTGMNKI
jgi:hypothetical protein